jgi:hypothetical protein
MEPRACRAQPGSQQQPPKWPIPRLLRNWTCLVLWKLQGQTGPSSKLWARKPGGGFEECSSQMCVSGCVSPALTGTHL